MTVEETFRPAMRAEGIDYTGQIYPDGKLHRFKAGEDHHKNSWYVFHAGPPAAGAFGCWKRDLNKTWCERGGSLTKEEWQHVRGKWQEAKAKQKAETAALQERARKIAAWILSHSRPARTLHRYLDRKRAGVFGNVREYSRSLVVPLQDVSGKLHSLQFIDEGGKKRLKRRRAACCFFMRLIKRTDRW